MTEAKRNRGGRPRTLDPNVKVITTQMEPALLKNLDAMAEKTTGGNRTFLIRKILSDVTSAWLLAQGE